MIINLPLASPVPSPAVAECMLHSRPTPAPVPKVVCDLRPSTHTTSAGDPCNHPNCYEPALRLPIGAAADTASPPPDPPGSRWPCGPVFESSSRTFLRRPE